MTLQDHLPPGPAHYCLTVIGRRLARLKGDAGDVSITGTVIIAAALALIAVALTVAINGKVRHFISQIPG
jgi:hypothetical protein